MVIKLAFFVEYGWLLEHVLTGPRNRVRQRYSGTVLLVQAFLQS